MGRRISLLAAIWLAIALLAGASGATAALRPPRPQLLLVALVLALLAAWRLHAGFRTWLRELPVEALIAVHLSRFVGFYFLALYREGRLPYAFAVPGGWGDIAVASAAGAILLSRVLGARVPRAALALWNALGAIDIVLVIASAARLALADPDSMRELLRLPLGLLPTFLVPIIVFTHVAIGARLHASSTPGP